jgi:hypothetical protein
MATSLEEAATMLHMKKDMLVEERLKKGNDANLS